MVLKAIGAGRSSQRVCWGIALQGGLQKRTPKKVEVERKKSFKPRLRIEGKGPYLRKDSERKATFMLALAKKKTTPMGEKKVWTCTNSPQ